MQSEKHSTMRALHRVRDMAMEIIILLGKKKKMSGPRVLGLSSFQTDAKPTSEAQAWDRQEARMEKNATV